MRRVDFVATKRSLLCSQHFKPHDFDMTGQIVRLRADVVPSVFNFPTPNQTAKRATSSSKKEDESQPLDLTKPSSKVEPQTNIASIYDHNYALPTCPTAIKAKLNKAFARVETLEREKRNAKIRELRAKKNMDSALQNLRRKNLVNKKLRAKLEHFSGTRVSTAKHRHADEC